MNGFKKWALQDLSYLPKSVQHETHVPTNTFKRYLSNFLNSSRKQDNGYDSRKINVSRDQLKSQNLQKHDLSPSSKFQNYTPKDLFSSTTTERGIQQLSQAFHILQIPAVTFKPLPSLFETLQQSNTNTMKTQEYTKFAAKSLAIANIEIPCKIMSKWPYMDPHREYHKKTFKIENLAKCEDYLLFTSDIPTTRQKQSAGYRLSQFDRLVYSKSSGTKESRKPLSYLPSVPCRFFSSKSCTEVQQFIRKIENLKKNPNPNALIVRLRSTQSHSELSIAGHIPLAKRRSFSDDASRSERFADCEEDDTTKREVETEREYGECSQKRSRRRIEERTCERSRRKDTCDSSQVSERRRERKSKSCESYTCPELTKPKPCSGNQELAPEAPIKSDARRRVSSRKRARQLTDGDCSQKKDIDTRCRRQSKSYKHEDCEKSRTICKDSVQKNNDSKSRYKKRCENRDISNKERRSARKRSNSCRKRNSSRASNKSCSKVEEKRRCGKDEEDQKQDPFCEKPKRTCETKKKKPKCVKGPAKCMSKKKTADKKKFCQSVQKDEKLKKEIKKAPLPCTTTKDKTPKEETTKQQIEREYKEINECKKGFKKGKKDGKAKMVSVEHKPTDLDNRIIGSYKEQQEKNSEKSASTLNESVISTNKIFKWSNVQSIINGRIPITKDVSLFNVMFDRLFSTAKPDYQDDFAIERTDDKMSRNYSANSDDFVHDDELPNYVEIEYEDEEDDVYDRATNRQVFEID